jgi:hypothetical protein
MPHPTLNAKRKVAQSIDETKHRHLLSLLPALTVGQAKTLSARPEICDKLKVAMEKLSGDDELFHAWLKKNEVN